MLEDIPAPFLKDRRLVEVLGGWTPSFPRYYAFYSSRRHPLRAVTLFVDLLRQGNLGLSGALAARYMKRLAPTKDAEQHPNGHRPVAPSASWPKADIDQVQNERLLPFVSSLSCISVVTASVFVRHRNGHTPFITQP